MSKERLSRLVPPLAAAAGGLAMRLYYRRKMQEQQQRFKENLDIANARERIAEEKADEYKALSGTDALTGLANRRSFDEVCGRVAARTRRYPDRKNSALLLDLDNLKNTNDAGGHAAGDQLICDAADIMRSNARAEDIPARIGGDEMSLVMPNASEREAALAAERLLAAFNEQGIRASVGVAEFDKIHSAEDIVTLADRAMYYGKQNGGNQVVLASSLAVPHN